MAAEALKRAAQAIDRAEMVVVDHWGGHVTGERDPNVPGCP